MKTKPSLGHRAPFQPGFNALPLTSTKKPRNRFRRNVDGAANCKSKATPLEGGERSEAMPRASAVAVERRGESNVVMF